MAVTQGRIVFVGAEDQARAHAVDGATVVDAAGRLVLPGFIDSHNHLRLGSGSGAVQLAGATSLGEIRARIGGWLDDNPDATWVHGEGFDYAAFPNSRHPHADDLTDATRGLPAMLLDYSVHAAWFNHEALAALGAVANSPRVAYGNFEVDAQGQLTGYLADFATAGLSRRGLAALSQVVPAYGFDAQYERVTSALDMAVSVGITTVVEPQNSVDDLALFAQAREEGRLRARVIAALFHPVGTTADEIDEFEMAIEQFSDDQFRVGPIKLYIDDIVEPHTAAMLLPYANRPDTRGTTYYEASEFARVLTELDSRGLQCFVHATGDRGIRTVLDAFEQAQSANSSGDRRHQIVHVECLDVEDISRFGELGVVACMQPRHCAPEIVAQWRANVGEERWRYAWAMRSLIEAGAPVAFSSDWNVAEMDPLIGLYSALTRASLDGSDSWVPQETVDLETALRAYTIDGAWANHCERDRGSLEVGKYADFVMLSDDLFELSPDQFLTTRVLLTVVGGQVVYESVY
jgi:hypothetical protein